jgi:RNA polymerase sigma factor (sigma-70 family)
MSVRKQLHDKQKLALLAVKQEQSNLHSPLEITHLQEIRKLIGEAVTAMPGQRRRIYELSRQEGMKIEEIAQHLGITTRTVKNVLSIALQSIREHLERSGHSALLIIYACFYNLYP